MKMAFPAVTAERSYTRARVWDHILVQGEPRAGGRASGLDSGALGKLFLFPRPQFPKRSGFSDVICETTAATKAPHGHIGSSSPPGLLSWLA